jgi:hypothetical protein
MTSLVMELKDAFTSMALAISKRTAVQDAENR